ncbi:MAG TPA: hypothetical protein VL362_01370 [Patescibacteria group bacterium]|jgi:hypothetical protein|nr:hypothetical protein [Patescibacteria group bacterium]
MALIFMDGFDAGDAGMKWSFAWSGSRSTDTRFGQGSSWFISPIGAYLYKNFTPMNKIFLGFAAKFTAATGQVDFCRIGSDAGATSHLWLRYSTGGALQLVRGDGTILATATGAAFAFNTWSYYFEVSATIADAGGTCVVRVNGNTVINYTGDTKNGGTATTIDQIRFHPGSASGLPTIMIDDLYVCDDTGVAPYNTFLGDVRVHTMVPDAAGTSTQFTPSAGANYTDVDELPYSATDYVRSSVAGTRDTYSMNDLPAGVTTVYGVQNNIIAKKTDAGSISLKPVTRSGGTNYYGSTVSLGTSDTVISDLRSTDPATSSQWAASAVNSMESGMEVA